MIRVTRLDGSEVTINCDLVESIERTPDTVISLLNAHKLVVRESVSELVDRVVAYRRRSAACPFMRSVIQVTGRTAADLEDEASGRMGR